MPDDESQAPEEDEGSESDFGDPGGLPGGGASSGGKEDSKDEEGPRARKTPILKPPDLRKLKSSSVHLQRRGRKTRSRSSRHYLSRAHHLPTRDASNRACSSLPKALAFTVADVFQTNLLLKPNPMGKRKK